MTDDPRSRLLQERHRLDAVVAAIQSGEDTGTTERESTAELSDDDQHPADTATETFDRERDYSILEQVQAELDEVGAALDRLERGKYGRCEVCGEAIGAERLEAEPAARYCVRHQSQAESTGPAVGLT